jgi:hypothetical protein
MPFRPTPSHRRNIPGVIYALTEAIRRTFGCRAGDGAYPLGAFSVVTLPDGKQARNEHVV